LQRHARRLKVVPSASQLNKILLSSQTQGVQQDAFSRITAASATEVQFALSKTPDASVCESETKRAEDLLAVFCSDLDRDLMAIDCELQAIGAGIRQEHQQVLSSLEAALSSGLETACSRNGSRRFPRIHIQRRFRSKVKLVVMYKPNASTVHQEANKVEQATAQTITTESARIIQTQLRERLYQRLYRGGRSHFNRVCSFRRRLALIRVWRAWQCATRESKKARVRRLELVLMRLGKKTDEWRLATAPSIMVNDGKYGAAKQFATFSVQLRVFRAWLSMVVVSHQRCRFGQVRLQTSATDAGESS
jgi:hypothetical protein